MRGGIRHDIAMRLKDWRGRENLTLLDCATRLGLRDGRAFQRYETGEHRPDAPLLDQICLMTGGDVSLTDMHQQRLDWLRERGEKKMEAAE